MGQLRGREGEGRSRKMSGEEGRKKETHTGRGR